MLNVINSNVKKSEIKLFFKVTFFEIILRKLFTDKTTKEFLRIK